MEDKKNIKLYGKIIEFDNLTGYINCASDQNKYYFSQDNVIGKEVKSNDAVSFTPEYLKTPEIQVYVARDVKLIKR